MIEQETYTMRADGGLVEQPSPAQDSSKAPGIAVIGMLTLLIRRKRPILIATAAGVIAGVLYCLTLPPLYTATTRIMTPQQTQSSAALMMSQLSNSGAASLAAAAGSGALGLKNPNDLYVGLLSSRPVADEVIREFGLAALYKARDLTDARKQLAENTRVASEKSGLLSIAVTDKDKKRAADMANAYTAQLRNLTQTLAITEASQRRLFYEEQLKHAKDDLVAAELSFQQVQQKKGLVQLDAQARATIEELAVLHAQVAAKQVELQAMRSYSTEINPSVQLAENELSSLQGATAQLEQRSHTSGSTNLGLQDMATAGLEYLRAQHELQYRQVLFDLLLKQYDAARLDEAKYAAVIQVVEPGIPPDQKSSPHRALIVLVFLMLGFLGEVSYLLAVHYIKTTPGVSRALGELRAALAYR